MDAVGTDQERGRRALAVLEQDLDVLAGLHQPDKSMYTLGLCRHTDNASSCHGQDGRGSAVGKSLHAADFHSAQVQQQSDEQLANVIAEGRGNMPAFGTRLSKGQVDALVKYVRSLGKGK